MKRNYSDVNFEQLQQDIENEELQEILKYSSKTMVELDKEIDKYKLLQKGELAKALNNKDKYWDYLMEAQNYSKLAKQVQLAKDNYYLIRAEKMKKLF